MAIATRVWTVGRIVLLCAGLAATFVVFAAAAMQVAVRSLEVAVPNLTGRSVNEATTLVGENGLTLRVDEARRLDPKIAAGRVVAQDPQPGARARRQRTIRVWLSAGAKSTIIPSLIGESDRTAQLRLQQDALELAGVAEIRSGDYPAGAIVAQQPPPASRGTRVSILVNRGERAATYIMPDLIGVNGDRAADVLRAGGFRVAVVGDHPYPGVPAGIILRQHPQGGFQIAPGEPVSLEVSR